MASTDILYDLGLTLKRFKMFPYFTIANFILMCIGVREDSILYPTAGKVQFSRLHPLTSWVASMLLCFAGGILSNLLLGQPLLEPMESDSTVLIATAVWYLINYAPFDIVYKLCKFKPVRIVILILKEIQRTNGVHHGITYALQTFPGSHILICLFGILKGSAANHMKLFQRMICGYWQPTSSDILQPSIITKGSGVVSILFILHYKNFIEVQDEILYLAIVFFFLLLRLLTAYNIDPFAPFENMFCALFMGGVIDSLKRASAKTPSNDITATGGTTNLGKNHLKKEKAKDE